MTGRDPSRRRAAARTLALVLVLAGWACSPSGTRDGAEGTPVPGGTLVDYYNWASAPGDHIDPALARTVEDSQPGLLLFDGLTDYDNKTGELEPAVAERWSSNADATVWTFTLRRGVRFSNGDPVLPSDFKYAWERAASPQLASPLAYHFTSNARIKGATEVNAGTATKMRGVIADNAAYTLTVELEAPLSLFPEVVANLAFSPVPQSLVQALPDQARWDQGIMIGNGPYKMRRPWKPERGLILTRNEAYWGGIHRHRAYIDTIEFRVSNDVDSAWAAFESGQGQTGRVPPARYADARKQHPGRVATEPANGLSFWSFNMKDPVVGGSENLKLRQAISLAVDRQRIANDVFNGSRPVATGIAPPGIRGYKPGISQYATRDLARARRLLGEWEQATGRQAPGLPPIRLSFNSGAGHEPVATIIQQNLADLGIRSDLDPREGRTYPARMAAGEGQFFRYGWAADYNDYDNMLWPLFSRQSADNVSQYASPAFEATISDARRTAEDGQRYDRYQQAESIVLNEDTVVVTLTWLAGTIAWGPQVHDVVLSPLLNVAYDEMWLSA